MKERNERHRRNPDAGKWFDEEIPGMDAVASRRVVVDWRPRGWVTITLMLMLGALMMAFFYMRDESAPWDEDLTVAIPVASNKDISAPVRIKALLNTAAKMNLSALSAKPPWEWDTPVLANALETHSVVLDNFRDLLEEKEEEWLPTSASWWAEDLGYSFAWQEIILLKQAEAVYLERRNQEEAAFLAALDMAVMAHLLERIHAWPSFMRCALDLHERSAQSVALLLQNTQLPAEKLHHIQEMECKPWAPSEAALSQAMRDYYAFEKRFIVGPRPGDPPIPRDCIPARSGWLYFKPQATLHLFAESFRELKDEAALTPFARVDQTGMRQLRYSHMMKHGFSGPNQSGEEYFYKRIQEYRPMLDVHSNARACHAVVMTLFAVRTYAAKLGRLPQKLDDLVPKFILKQVLDPYSGEPLRYDPARGLVYSVGANLKDSGGSPNPVPFADTSAPTAKIGISVAAAVSAETKKSE